MSLHWSERELPVVDFETTGTNPHEDRIVEAAFAIVKPDGTLGEGSFHTIVNPGVEIPEEAAAVHGITTERAQAEGMAVVDVLRRFADYVAVTAQFGKPLVIYNVPFDWPLLLAECDRHGVEIRRDVMLIDPLLLDRHFDKYRRGGRKLETVAKHYGVELTDAHAAQADAIAAAGVTRALFRRYEGLKTQTLEALQSLQQQWYDEWKDGLNAYWARNGKSDRITGSWPLGLDEEERAVV